MWVRETASTSVTIGLPTSSVEALDLHERERWTRLVQPRDATAYLELHLLARREIGRQVGVPAAALRFDRACPDCGRQHGVPRLLDDHGLHLSLSRSGSVVALALSRSGPVGVDVDQVGGTQFSGYEDVALHADERDQTASGFADATTWVRKEAALKALGVGLRVDPTTFAAPPRRGRPRMVPGMPPVTVVDLDVPMPYAAAVALRSPPGALTVRRH